MLCSVVYCHYCGVVYWCGVGVVYWCGVGVVYWCGVGVVCWCSVGAGGSWCCCVALSSCFSQPTTPNSDRGTPPMHVPSSPPTSATTHAHPDVPPSLLSTATVQFGLPLYDAIFVSLRLAPQSPTSLPFSLLSSTHI